MNNQEPVRWVTFRGKRLPVGADGKIIKMSNEKIDNLKAKREHPFIIRDEELKVYTKQQELKWANSKYRKINNLKKSYEKKGQKYPDLDYWQEIKNKKNQAQRNYEEQLKKYKNSVWGNINITENKED